MKLLEVIHTKVNNCATCAWTSSVTFRSGGTDKTIKAWDSITGMMLSRKDTPDFVECSASCDELIWYGLSNGDVSLTSGVAFSTGLGRIVEITAYNNSILVSAVDSSSGITVNHVALFTHNGELKWKWQTPMPSYGLCFSDAGTTVFNGQADPRGGVLNQRDAATGVVKGVRTVATDAIMDLAHWNGEIAVAQVNTGQASASVRFIDSQTLDEKDSLPQRPQSGVTSLAYSYDGSRLCLGENNYDVSVVNRADKQQVYKATGLSVPKKVSWHPTRNDLFLVARAHGVAELHDLRPEPVKPAPVPPAPTKPKRKGK